MIRILAVCLLFGYTLVPPGVCSCRLQELLFPAERDHYCPDQDEHDDDCVRIQQDCVVLPSDAIQFSQAPCVIAPRANEALPPCAVAREQHPDRFRWPDSPPLYLTLRALLI